MKKLLSLLLCLCLALSALPSLADEPATGVRFALTFHLNTDALSPALRDHARGYADLLDALRFEGTFASSLDGHYFDLSLTLIPVDPDASPVDLRFWGEEQYIYVNSPLLGEDQILISTDSLLEFCVKTYEHLGLPLQNLALLYPYAWRTGFRKPIDDWNEAVAAMDESGVMSAETVAQLTKNWEDRLAANRAVEVVTTALGLDTGFDEAAQAIFSELPSWFRETVAGNGEIRVTREEGAEVWSAACGDFAIVRSGENHEEVTLNLPELSSGYVPFFSFQRTVDQNQQSGQLKIQLLSADPEDQDFLNLQLSAASLPVSLGVDSVSLIQLSLTGGVYPNLGCVVYLETGADGAVHAELRKPSLENGEPGATMLSLDGSILPLEEEVTVSGFSWDDYNTSTDILRTNDTTLAAFVPKIIEPFASGILNFLFGIPTSSCQVILDDLTDAGVLNVLTGE